MEFRIEHEWDSSPVTHDPVTICLKPEKEGLLIDVNAPFFNDPPAPPGPSGEAFPGLWDYEGRGAIFDHTYCPPLLNVGTSSKLHWEDLRNADQQVVEAFFLNDEKEQYLEVELCPHGHHLVLLLSRRRNIWKDCLPLSVQVSRTDSKWNGTALVPWDYFPQSVDKFNAYAIHGSGSERRYEALYPVPTNEVQSGQQPDFHRLEYFRPFNFSALMGGKWEQPESSLWKV